MTITLIPECSLVHDWAVQHPWLAALFGPGVLLWWSVWL